MKKYVYYFDEGNGQMKDLLGGKGANLAEMVSLGIPVPSGFVITTEVCDIYNKNNKTYPKEVLDQVHKNLERLEKDMKAGFGDEENPLLVSVRSGAKVSMPGMMDTVLNLGLNDETIRGLIKKTGNERFAYDSYRRFINMFGDVVMGVEHKHFEEVLDKIKETKGVAYDTELDASDLKKVVEEYKKIIKKHTGTSFPDDPKKQLQMAIDAVFNSWMGKRAVAYRRIHDIKGLLGTAVNVQTMVFGNMGNTSATGVAFTRDPSTGENKFYGEFLINAQGEDVVAGIRTPEPISKLKEKMPEAYKKLESIYKRLEHHYKDMQDIEFTIQEGKLFMLQTRTGKRTALAAIRIAVEMDKEGLIDRDTALLRVDPNQLNQLLHKQLDPIAKSKAKIIGKGLPASPGGAVGQVAFTAERAKELANEGNKIILVRTETSPEDIEGMNAAQGILTARGGMTSHAAVVARGMGKCCVAGCGDIAINEKEKYFMANGVKVNELDWITLDGSEGEVYLGQVPVKDPEISGYFQTLMKWADEKRKLKVRTNADTPKDAEVALKFGAEGIGLTRTEHMFFEGERIKAVREMILADDEAGRKKALAKILPYQKSDFIGIFKVMSGLPVTIRLLDPPLHEFLPKEEKEINELAREMKVPVEKLKSTIANLFEFNPMLGFRGCRLALVYPEIAEMQTTAIIEAAIDVNKSGKKALPEIEIPVVANSKEIEILKDIIVNTAEKLIKQSGVKVHYKIGTMIELPRACVTADEIAPHVEFMSFGTNDLTQTTYGFSRDDAGKFIPKYIEAGIFEKDPFQEIDRFGIGSLMKLCVEKARKVKPMEFGICGEHGGDPNSVEFCHEIGLDYVSCSPYRVPIARLAAAQAVLKGL
ncbi:MAG TPA: pyruvate, phosphate dikinase [Candidatus Nanoarchaeia archaeon]|nr:pyruvate, phosphate dikinase [Candidatus Nanoarchaeia archaeon]